MKIYPLNTPIGSGYSVETLRESSEESARKRQKDPQRKARERATESQKSAPPQAEINPLENSESQILDTEKLLKLLDRAKDPRSKPGAAFNDGFNAKPLTGKAASRKKI